jgi:hypothetical protein
MRSNHYHNTKATSYSRTLVHMNLFDRFTRVVNSNLNNILKSLEDPEKIMNQALEDMQVNKYMHFIIFVVLLLFDMRYSMFFLSSYGTKMIPNSRVVN